MQLPSFTSYGNYSSDNYGAHALRFSLGADTFWFSYKTLVAFQKGCDRIVCRVNDWGPTTGKHLNSIQPDKKQRVSGAEFEAAFAKAFPAK